MPQVTATPRGQSNGQTITEFIDSVGTSTVTYTYPKTQETLSIRNTGEKSITVTVGGIAQTVKPGDKLDKEADFSSFDIAATSGVQSFEARTDEKGWSFDSPEGKLVASFSAISVDVKYFGASGDGVTDDTLAFYKAINALPDGGTVNLERGKTYLLSKEIRLNPKTILNGNGATLKRINQIRTTTSTAIGPTNGSAFAFTVASATGLRVGMRIMLINGTTYSIDNLEIKSINGNTIEVFNSRSGESFPIGSYVQSACWAIQMQDDCVVQNLRIDGNKANQTTARWEHHQEIVTANRCVVKDCYIANTPGEGIVVAGTHSKVIGNHLNWCGGNGIHFSGATYSLCKDNYLISTNQIAGVGHEDGAIILSNLCSDLVIDGNYMLACKSGIGSVDYDGNSDLTITNNIIRNASTMAFDIERYVPDGAPKNLIIKGNRVYSSVVFAINNVSADLANAIYNVIVTDNYFYNTPCRIVSSDHVLFENNIVDIVSTNRCLEINNSTNIIVKGNLFKGGSYGVHLQGANTKSVNVSHNNICGQSTAGIFANEAPVDTVSFIGNNITNLAIALASYIGINMKPRIFATGNNITMLAGQFGIITASDTCITNNKIITPATIPSLKVYGGQTNTVMMGNMFNQAIAKSAGDTNPDINNIVIVA